MNILVIENSTNQLSVALKKDGSVFEQNTYNRHNSSHLLNTIKTLTDMAEIDVKNINAVGIGLGPGSFTGLRIACSAAQGLCRALNKPLIGLSSFLALGLEYRCNDALTIIITDARKSLVYAAVYGPDNNTTIPLVKEHLTDLNSFLREIPSRKSIFIGESYKFIEQINAKHPACVISDSANYPKARYLLDCAEAEYAHNHFVKPEQLQPIYLYEETCHIKK